MRRTPASRGLIASTSIVASLAFLAVTEVNVALSDIGATFGGPDLVELSWAVTAYAAVFAAALVPAGRLADVLGHRRILILGTAAFVVASALATAAPTLGVLVGARTGQAVAAGLVVPASFGLLLRELSPRCRAHGVALWSAGAATSAFLGPSLGGVLVGLVGWRALFAVNVPVGLLLLVYFARLEPRSRSAGGALPDPIGVAAVSGAMALLVTALTQSAAWGWGDARIVAMVLAAALGGAIALARSANGGGPVIDLDLLARPTFAVANAVSLVFALAAFAWLLAGPLFVARVWGYGTLEAALSIAPSALTAAVASVLVGRLRARDRARAIVAGAVLFAATSVGLAVAVGPTPLLSVWIAAGALAGAAMGGVLASLSATVASAAPPERFGAAAGINVTARQFGGSLGVALLAALVGASGGVAADFTIVWLVGAAAGLLAAAGGVVLARSLEARSS